MSDYGVKLRDTCEFTDQGRQLLVSLGVVDPDPLMVEAERWLLTRPFGPMTIAAHRVRIALGPAWPDEYLEAAAQMRATSWRGPLS